VLTQALLLSNEQASPQSKIHNTSLLSTPWPIWTAILSQVTKNDDEKTLLFRVIWLYVKKNQERMRTELSLEDKISNLFFT